jgi:hypothetical protein
LNESFEINTGANKNMQYVHTVQIFIPIDFFPHRPFPFKRPVIYHGGTPNICNVKNRVGNLSQSVWINVVALEDHEPDVAANTRIHFYGLTHVNNSVADSGNYGLQNSSETLELSILTFERHNPINFKFALIPTSEDNDPRDTELNKYCSPSELTEWVKLEGYENQIIWVLALKTASLLKKREIKPTSPLIITFTFPSIITVFNLMELEEKAAERHHCKLINCREFLICPTTLEEPTSTQSPHWHCMSDKCVRFYEMTKLPTDYQPA